MTFVILGIITNIIYLIIYKITERLNCEPVKICFPFFSVSTGIATLYALYTRNLIFNYKALIIALVCGLTLSYSVYSFLFLIKVGKFGLSLIITNLYFLIPVIISIFIYKEKPTILIYASFALIILTFYLLAETSKKIETNKRNKTWIILAIIVMLSSGIAYTGPKLIKELNLSNFTFSYLSYMYFFGLVPMLIICIKRKCFPGKKEWLLGSGLGFLSFLSLTFLIFSLKEVPGTIVYPLVLISVGIVVVLLSFFIWKERLNLKQIIGVCTGIIAAVLLNLHI
jgi:drug/metabolite transporter (DMT)-like permease